MLERGRTGSFLLCRKWETLACVRVQIKSSILILFTGFATCETVTVSEANVFNYESKPMIFNKVSFRWKLAYSFLVLEPLPESFFCFIAFSTFVRSTFSFSPGLSFMELLVDDFFMGPFFTSSRGIIS